MNKDESTLLHVCVSYSPVSKGFQPELWQFRWFLASLLSQFSLYKALKLKARNLTGAKETRT